MAVDVKMMEVKKTQELSKPVRIMSKNKLVKAGQWHNFLGRC